MRVVAIIALLLVAAAPAAMAQNAPAQPTPQALADVYSCAAITGAEQRLACFDAAVGRLHQAETQGQVVAVDREQAQIIQRDAFGFHLPSIARLLPNLRGEAAQVEFDRVQMTIASVRDHPHGVHTFVMENGQSWTQTEGQSVRTIRPGDVVTIQRAALGSFRLIPSHGGAGHRVHRDN